MKLRLHHINLSTERVSELDAFYRELFDMHDEPAITANRVLNQGYPGQVAILSDGHLQLHIATKDLGINFRTKQAINPVERGHIAFRTDDLATFKKRLEARSIPYADFGDWAMAGWQQIFFYDPDGNIIEVHEVAKGAIG